MMATASPPSKSRLLILLAVLGGACFVAMVKPMLFRALPQAETGDTQAISKSQTLKVEAPSVVVDVIATDGKGRHVSGLTAEDFRVYEDGSLQRIVTFVPPAQRTEPLVPTPPNVEAKAPAPVQAPSAAAQPGQAETPAESARDAQQLANTRFITLVIDLGDIQPGNLMRIRQAARDYLRHHVAAEDFVSIYWIDASLHMGLPYSQDKDEAVRTVEKICQRILTGRLTATARIETQQEIDELRSRLYGLASAAGPAGGLVREERAASRRRF